MMEFYQLEKKMLDIPKGVVFALMPWSADYPELGNIGCGTLTLAWQNHNCQSRWCGGAIALPGQYAKSDFFTRILNSDGMFTAPKMVRRSPISNCALSDICSYYTTPKGEGE